MAAWQVLSGTCCSVPDRDQEPGGHAKCVENAPARGVGWGFASSQGHRKTRVD
jgi:hypothetical protein